MNLLELSLISIKQLYLTFFLLHGLLRVNSTFGSFFIFKYISNNKQLSLID